MTTITCDGAGAGTANCGLTLEKWLKAITSRVAGAPASLIRCELEAALHDFYHRSTAWREVIGPFNIAANQEFIWLNPVDMYADVQHIFGAYLLINQQRVALRPMYVPCPGIAQASQPTGYYCAEPYTMQLSPVPNVAIGRVLYVDAAMAPLAGTERLPEISASHHFEGILAGALARLYAIPGKPWTNQQAAVLSGREYARRIVVARDQATRGHTTLDIPFQFPKWA